MLMRSIRRPTPTAALPVALPAALLLTCHLLAATPGATMPNDRPAAAATGDAGPWVVHAILDHATEAELRAAARQVAEWADHVGVYPEKRSLLLQVDAEERARLAALGFTVAVDARRTALLERGSLGRGQAAAGALPPGGIPGFPCYRTVEETFATAAGLAAARPDLASWVDIGDSWEKSVDPADGYDLRVLVLTNGAVAGPKPALFVTGAIHAREYTTAELLTRFAERLVAGHGVDPESTWLLDHHQIHLLLQTNPDGRKMAETGLSWRKNTNNDFCTGSNSRGIDLNRNFSFQWGCCGGSSGSECSTTYRGPAPASEPESQAVEAHILSLFPDQRGPALTDPAPADATGIYIDVHSFGEVLLSSWGFTSTPPPNGDGILRLARKWAFFSGYDAQLGSLGTVDGSTKDFAYGELGVPGYTYELGTSFFEDCPFFEAGVLPGGLAMLTYAAKAVRTPYLTPAGPDVVAPVVPFEAFAAGDPVPLTATVDDTRYRGGEPSQPIAGAVYSIDTAPWEVGVTLLPLAADDGTFDSTVEPVSATIDTSGLAVGRHLIYLQGEDSAGNLGAVSAAFVHIIDPATAPLIEGTVRDAITGVPIIATVTATSATSSPFETSSAPATGNYSLQLPAGDYDLTATAPGYGPMTVAGISVADLDTLEQDFALPPLVALLDDDVETGNIGWSTDPPWAITDASSNSPTHSWTDSPGGDYGNNVNAALTSPVLDLSEISGVTLTFHHRFELESSFDFGRMEVSTDGGGSWSEVATFNGTQAAWLPVELVLPQLDGVAAARVRFRLETDISVTRDGWYLDDLRVTGFQPPPADLIFSDGFESGNTSAWALTVP